MQKGCPEPGYDGENCSSPCSDNCQESHCDIVNKTCLGCVAGYIGSQCIEGTHSICQLVYINLSMISQQQVFMIFIVSYVLIHYKKKKVLYMIFSSHKILEDFKLKKKKS